MSTTQDPLTDPLTRQDAAAACGRRRAGRLRRVAPGRMRQLELELGLVVTGRLASEAITGQAILSNYPGWMGKNNLVGVRREVSRRLDQDDLERHLAAPPRSCSSSRASNTTSCSRTPPTRARPPPPDFITKLDWSKIPNIKNIAPKFRKAYPWGLPTDYGKVGIAYRPDLVGNATIESWHDFWELIPKYSGQTVFIDLERDCMGSTCKYLGYSSNTTDPDEMKKVQDTIVAAKPHLKAFLNTNVGAGPGQRLDRDGDGLGLRRRAAPAEERQDQVGAARRGRARLPRGLHRRAGHRARST